jgi:hypothetical protein
MSRVIPIAELRSRLNGGRQAWLARWNDRAFRATNAVMFRVYRMAGRLRRHDRVRSVLQLSIISHKPYMVSRVLRDEGLKSDFFALNEDIASTTLNLGADYHLPYKLQGRRRQWAEAFYLWTVLARYDVIHSHFKTFLSNDGWEFEYLRKLGKVIVFHFRGCDIRYRSKNMALTPELNCCQECEYPVGSCDTDYQHQQVRRAVELGDMFFVTTPDLKPFVPSAEHIPFIHPVGIDFDAITPAPKTPGVFRVVTSSNHHGLDGTRFIRAAVARLQSEGRAIELVEVSKMAYRDALAVYKSGDVYAGKLRMGYYNNANIETLLLGVPNMSYVREEFRHLVPDSPIIDATPDTIYDRLNYYIDRRDELRAIGARGPAFIKAHHDPHVIARRMIDRYNSVLARKRKAEQT